MMCDALLILCFCLRMRILIIGNRMMRYPISVHNVVTSERLRKILPGLRGFSANRLKNMRKFYEQWSMFDKSTIMNVETANSNSTIAIVELPNVIESIIKETLRKLTETICKAFRKDVDNKCPPQK